ncbi:hypothetical protein HLB23_29390 [Nocardia uniformis]|uniref:Uncharacterized protein n=1 Tax=Nocardia uniformis TaxID=53432 RepID=A0A849C5L5_9NOCA|nr:hypothetical protein [Nocardia uniformis]NNH73922.1 hypothetical protein [Nocardia uniformis]
MATDTVPQPPYSTELLADLHAGNMPDHLSRRLWPQVRRDPDAMRYLHALDRVNTDLHALGRDERIIHPMPLEVTARLDHLIDDLAAATASDQNERTATVHRIHPDRAPAATAPMPALSAFDTGQLSAADIEGSGFDNHEFDTDSSEFDAGSEFDDTVREPATWSGPLRWITAAAAAIAVIAGTLVAVDAVRSREATPVAAPAPIELSTELPPTDVLTAMGRNDVTGPLATREALSGCLTAAGLDRAILGSRNVTFAGQAAVLVLLTGPQAPQITAVVVDTACGPSDPRLLARADIG